MKKIGVLGSFSGRNIGDDAILRGMLHVFKRTSGDFKIILLTKFPKYFNGFSPDIIPKRSRISLLSINSFLAILNSDILLVTQSNLFSQRLFNPFYNRVIIYYLIIIFNKLFAKKKIGLFFGGIGPITTPFSEILIKNIVNNFDFLLFREKKAVKYLEKWGIEKDYYLGADIALFCGSKSSALTKDMQARIQGKTVLGININIYFSKFSGKQITKEDILEQMTIFLRAQKNTFFIFMPSDTEDVGITKELISQAGLDDKSWTLIEKCTPEEYIEIQSMCNYFIGTRMHSLIMCALAGTPLIGINYNPKVKDFMEQLDCEDYCIEYSELDSTILNSKYEALSISETELRKKIEQNVISMKNSIIQSMSGIK